MLHFGCPPFSTPNHIQIYFSPCSSMPRSPIEICTSNICCTFIDFFLRAYIRVSLPTILLHPYLLINQGFKTSLTDPEVLQQHNMHKSLLLSITSTRSTSIQPPGQFILLPRCPLLHLLFYLQTFISLPFVSLL